MVFQVTYPLSDKITEEDIKRDDEMATARVRDLLTSDDPEDSTKKKQTSERINLKVCSFFVHCI